MKIRRNVYFDTDVAVALDALAGRPGGNASRMINDGMRDWLTRRATMKVDELLRPGIDRLTRELARNTGAIERLARDVSFTLEALVLYVRWDMTMRANAPDPDECDVAIGKDRYQRFLSQLARMIKTGGTTVPSNDDEEAVS